MREEYKHLDQREALKVENEVIKMKLMLEHGAAFQTVENAPALSPETEHEFLNYILDVERQEAMAKEVTVFEVLGSPRQFPKEEDLPEEKVPELVQELLRFMKTRGIELTVFSPNVTGRDVYRFITRELFSHRMLHIHMPGMVTCFIYDEFHPDYPYENSRTAVNECLKEIFSDHELQWVFQYEQILRLNDHTGLSIDQFRRLVNAYKKKFDHIEPLSLNVENCVIDQERCVVSGAFEICFTTRSEHILKMGSWRVHYRYWQEMDIWMIHEVFVEGIAF